MPTRVSFDIREYQEAEEEKQSPTNWANKVHDCLKPLALLSTWGWVILVFVSWYTEDIAGFRIFLGSYSRIDGTVHMTVGTVFMALLVLWLAVFGLEYFRLSRASWARYSLSRCLKVHPRSMAAFSEQIAAIRKDDPLAEFKVEVLTRDDKLLGAALFQIAGHGRRYADDGVPCAVLNTDGPVDMGEAATTGPHFSAPKQVI